MTARRKSARAKVLIGMKKFTTPIDANDWEANPINAFEMDFRRTVAHIRYFDEKMAELQETDLVWGKTKEVEVGASEFDGTDYTYEAKMSIYYEAQMVERKHLLDLQKVWINAKLDVAKLQLEQAKIVALDSVITRSLTRLGLNSADPEVRRVIREELLALPSVGSGVDGNTHEAQVVEDY